MNSRAALFAQAIRGPILMITVGVLFALHQAGVLAFWRSWPLILIVVGVMKLIERLYVQQPPPPGGRAYESARFIQRASRSHPGGRGVLDPRDFAGFQAGRSDCSLLAICVDCVGRRRASWKCASGFSETDRCRETGFPEAAWVLVVVLALIGSSAFEFQRPDNWFRQVGFQSGIEAFGEEHQYPLNTITRAVGAGTTHHYRGLSRRCKD